MSDSRKSRWQRFGMDSGWQRGDRGRGSVSAFGVSSASGSGWGSGGQAAATTQSLPGEHRADSARQVHHARIYDTRRSTRVAAAATTQSLADEHRADSARQDQHARIYDTRRSTRVARSSSSSEDHCHIREEARRRSDKRRSRSMPPSPHRLRQRKDEVHSSCSRDPPARRGSVWHPEFSP